MNIPVLVEPNASSGFRAVCGEPLRLECNAPTREEAIQKLRELIERRIDAGAEVISLSIGAAAHPLYAFAGMLKSDPLAAPWKDAMADYRRKCEDSQDIH